MGVTKRARVESDVEDWRDDRRQRGADGRLRRRGGHYYLAADVGARLPQRGFSKCTTISRGISVEWLLIQRVVAGDEREYEWGPVHRTGGWKADAAVRERREHRLDREHLRERRNGGTKLALFLLFSEFIAESPLS